MQKRRVSAFQFVNLPKIPRKRILLSRCMSECLPGTRWEETLREILSGILKKYIRGKRQLMLNFQITGEELTEPIEKSFVALEKESFVIGRHPSCEIQLNNRVVSSQHARIFMERGRFFIVDQSVNGTLLNSKPIKPKAPVPLNHGDCISIYPYQINFTLSQTVANEETSVDFAVESIAETTFEELLKRLSTPTPLLVLEVDPHARHLLVEVEHDLLIGLTEMIFGSDSGAANKLLRTLSNIETGVIEFLVLRVIRAIRETMADFSSKTLRLKQLLIHGGQSLKHPEAIADPLDPVLVLTARLVIAELLSYIRLYIPYKLLEDLLLPSSDSVRLELLGRWMNVVSAVKTELIVELGEIKLLAEELASLEPSDIILLSGIGVRYSDGELTGSVRARLGQNGAGCFSSDIISEPSSVKIMLNSFTVSTQPKGEKEAMEEKDLAESAQFVQSVPVTIVVELGRRNMTIADVSRLRLGQIIDLKRTPSEPVDLTIDGKVIGKGELVDIEGDLGVRILKLVR